MASRFGLKRVESQREHADSYLHKDPGRNWLNERPHSASRWPGREQHRDEEDFLREQLKEMDKHANRLQDMLTSERAKCSRLQLRCHQQEAELRHREQLGNRLKDRLSLLTDRHREKGPSIDVLNFPPRGRGKRQQSTKPLRTPVNRDHAALQVMLERREAELREAMKLRHSLTTMLHALRVDMEQTLLDSVDVSQDEDGQLDQAEVALGEHMTGGVVHGWRQAQKKLRQVLSEGQTVGSTDHDKLLAQLETELRETQQLVRLQQQLLQDSLDSPLPSELADSYFLEEWERLRMRWAELDHQKRTFERERLSFTDAAVRLSRERCDFEQQRASLVKQQYLTNSPSDIRRESSDFDFSGLGTGSMSGCLPITPSTTESDSASAAAGRRRAGVGVQTPSTPELFSALSLPHDRRSREAAHQSELWDRTDGTVYTQAPHLDWSF